MPKYNLSESSNQRQILKNLYQEYEPNLILGTAERMRDITDESIDLIVTSPPYGQIKDYQIEGQIGFGEGFDDYFSRLKSVWKECKRVLAPQRRLIINIGDQYLRATEYDRYRILPIGAQIIKDCTELGFDYLGDILWKKVSTTNTTGGCSLMGSLFYPRNGLVTFDYEHILIFKKVEGKEKPIPIEIKELSKIPLDEWKAWYVGHWVIPGIQQKEHIAMFPEEIPYRLIRMFSCIGDTILDPFAGSGTTLKVARNLNRKSIGYEINPEFITIAKSKVIESFVPRDFHYIIKTLVQLLPPEIEFDLRFSLQKSIICIKNIQTGKKIVIDYLKYPSNVNIGNEKNFDYPNLLANKFAENPTQNFLQGAKNWGEIDQFYLCIDDESLSEKKRTMIKEYYDQYPKNRFRYFFAHDINGFSIDL